MKTTVSTESLRHVPEQVRAVIGEFHQRVQKWYGERFDRMILYGSYARGDFHEDSDIDLLIILNDDKLSKLNEINNLVNLRLDLMMRHNVLLSTKAITNCAYQEGKSAIFHFIRKEGIVV